MLKFGYNIISQFGCRKPRRKVRSDSHWTDLYPSPEPFFLKKTITKTCDWVYGNIDSFFQGNSKQINAKYDESLIFSNDINAEYSQSWELNQGVVDIAFKDIKGSMGWLLPGFIRQFANRLHQQSLLYFYSDIMVEEESSELNYGGSVDANHASVNTGKFFYAIQEFKEDLSTKFLSISDWWVRFYHKLSIFFRIAHYKKPYYLLNDFTPQGYDHSINYQNYMIGGIDKSKLNPAVSFHIRN